MLRTLLMVILGLGFMFSINYVAANQTNQPAKVLYCNDGDTCRVIVNDALWLNVRLAGVDAPEVAGRNKKGQPLADEAKNYLNSRTKDQQVELRQVDLDHYNRPIVELLLKGENINLKLVELGYAEAYRGKTKRLNKEAYLAAETKAKKERLGLWALENYQSPAEFRQKKRRSKVEGVNSTAH